MTKISVALNAVLLIAVSYLYYLHFSKEKNEGAESLTAIIQKTPMFFDSPELQAAVREALDNVKICQIATQKLINSFTQRSKQKYIRIVDKPQEDEANE